MKLIKRPPKIHKMTTKSKKLAWKVKLDKTLSFKSRKAIAHLLMIIGNWF